VPPPEGLAATPLGALAGWGVYLAAEGGIQAPRSHAVPGKRLIRFMDSIYLDRPCEKLDVKRMRALNEARRPLLDRSEIGTVNSRVRDALAEGLRAARMDSILEWGCGYHPMRELLPDVRYAALDVDPAVVEWNRQEFANAGCDVFQADEDLPRIATASQHAIVSAFVFHFRLTRRHIATMHRVLTPDGFVLANVYRRTPRSRRDLRAEFERVGFRVSTAKDPAKLCLDHEFWVLSAVGNDDRDSSVLEAVRKALG
jgi:SAM-dependent methyltransferase